MIPEPRRLKRARREIQRLYDAKHFGPQRHKRFARACRVQVLWNRSHGCLGGKSFPWCDAMIRMCAIEIRMGHA